jgi:orotidine-5'-phosphate decarboxylase
MLLFKYVTVANRVGLNSILEVRMSRIIPRERSVIPACDVDLARFEEIVINTSDIPEIGAYKISAVLALSVGLPTVVKTARRHTNKPLIYDHQKAGTDIPETGKAFAAMLRTSGVDALIIFPLSGPATQVAWIQCAQKEGLPVIVGAHMTHERFLVSLGGYVDDSSMNKIYLTAAHDGVTDFVVPGNKPEIIKRYRETLRETGINPVFYAPGFISQGGRISDAAAVAGPSWHAIVGRAIYDAPDIRKAALELTAEI